VALSGLIEFNLEDYYDTSEKVGIDFKDFLTAIPLGKGNEIAYILKEKPFREMIANLDTSKYHNKYVAIYCSVEAIIPTWAYMLLSIALASNAKKVIIGSLETLETLLFEQALNNIDASKYKDAKVVIKGCSKYKIPTHAFSQIALLLKPFAKSLMFGEPCSTVPLFKKNKL
jgi:hypothetical protein